MSSIGVITRCVAPALCPHRGSPAAADTTADCQPPIQAVQICLSG